MSLPVDPARYGGFLLAMAIMAASPGPSNLFAVANGMSRGRRAVLLGVLGMNAATLLWYLAAALGLGALAKAYPQAVRILIAVCALYLIWLALSAIRSGFGAQGGMGHAKVHPERSALRDGFMVQVANPKILLFFGGVLPPFLDFARPLAPQFLMFAAATVTLDVISNISYGLGGAALAARMERPGFRRGFSVTVATVFLAAALLILTRGL